MRRFLLSLIILISFNKLYSQSLNQDIKHYIFDIELFDKSDSIKVKSTIIGTNKNETIVFNLKENMNIDSINNNKGEKLIYKRVNDSVYVNSNQNNFNINVYYRGIPQDGLIIGKNKYNKRTFFGDNWPNRAKYWLSVYDHPRDKASVEFIVSVPKVYDLVANGRFISKNIKNDKFVYRYKSSEELPTKVMVIGAAKFSQQIIQKQPYVVASFVYPEDEMEAFYDYAIAPQVLRFMENKFGKYPFDKLYNVQSTTKYGGMENAGCIFYDENAIDGKRSNESLVAHEIVHQWFGNTVTENDWIDLWLSEGFASYFENVFMEEKYGQEKMIEIMREHKYSVLAYKNKYPARVLVPDSISDPNIMLNTYSYKKGAWLLHMLRYELGDEAFYKSIRGFYNEYKYKNASTKDFVTFINNFNNKDLNKFFEPWLYSSTIPSYGLKWSYSDSKLKIRIRQLHHGETFYNSIPIHISYENGYGEYKKIEIDSKEVTKIIEVDFEPKDVLIDTDHKILKQ